MYTVLGLGNVMAKKGERFRSVFDMSDFASGWGGWSLSTCLPGAQTATAALVEGTGLLSSRLVEIGVAGSDGSSLVFLKRLLKAEDGMTFRGAVVAWWVKEPPPAGSSIHRAVYVGPPRQFDAPNEASGFRLLTGQEAVIPGTLRNGWVGLRHQVEFAVGLPEIQICIGWEVTGTAPTTFEVDSILTEAMEG